MIWVRWAIPDLSGSLRDRIRREAYITNEIIIKQEAERARKSMHGMYDPKPNLRISSAVTLKHFHCYFSDRTSSENPQTDILRIEQLMTNNLSSSQLDLVMHGEGDPFAPGHVKPRNYDSKLSQNDSKHSAMFLQTEKNGGVYRKNGAEKNRNQNDSKEPDDSKTETSSL